MKEYWIKKQPFSWQKEYEIKNKDQETVYTIRADSLSWGQTLQFYNEKEESVLSLMQLVCGTVPRYGLYEGDTELLEMYKKPGFRKSHYIINGKAWKVSGTPPTHTYQVLKEKEPVVGVSVQNILEEEHYAIEIYDETNSLLIIGLTFIIDFIMNS